MRKDEKELLLSWICNEELRLSDELSLLRNNLRFRRIDIADCFELALSQQRYSDFCDFSLVITRLLNLGGDMIETE